MNESTSIAPEVANKQAFTPISEAEMTRHLIAYRKTLLKYASINFKVDDILAEDLVGETVYKALKRRNTYDPSKGKPLTFLIRVLTNTYIDTTRSKRVNFNESFSSNEYTGKHGDVMRYDCQVDPEDLGSKHFFEMLQEAIRLLPNNLGEVMSRIAEGRKLEEIAQELDMPIGTVKAKSNLARRTLVHSLSSVGLVDAKKLGRSSYMLGAGIRVIPKNVVDNYTMAISQMAQSLLLK